MSKENIENNTLKQIKEGRSKIYIYNNDLNAIPSKSMSVFYNKKMEINRDISSLAIQSYYNLYAKNDLIIVDSMAGSGVGSIRLLKECKNIEKIYINDINPVAKDLIYKNLILNNFSENNLRIEVKNYDANFLFNKIAFKSKFKKPNVISIDPWGTPNCYINSAFKTIIKDNGLMCITATDTAVLFGVKSDVCLRKYMAKPLHNEFCKEIGTRILLYFISRIANINNMGILPLLSFYSNHFIRVFVKTFKNKNQIIKNIKNYGYIFYCEKCGNRFALKNKDITHIKICELCKSNNNLNYAGPLWLDKIHQLEFLNSILILNYESDYKNKNKIQKIINICKNEIDMPSNYYNLHKISKKNNFGNIPKIQTLIDIISEKGYKVSRTHFDFLSIKTNMDIKSLEKILNEYNNK
ncbi:MAG: tRNA (guanine(10)-N(2))-dimethyltransferase [Candidatus Lokiarchaeota archaeon]|nr:tRNA (guanine(10)-N(2))-dimethyltransferase [Candidatus Lokiarchaeota archaeon]